MRLWHKDLIPYLPNSQLRGQWSELGSIFKDEPNHILINDVYLYPTEHLYAYAQLVINEFKKRGFKIKVWDNYNNYFKDIDTNEIPSYGHIFCDFHNEKYLVKCYFNLQEKFDCEQKDFSLGVWKAIENTFGKRVLIEVQRQLGGVNYD